MDKMLGFAKRAFSSVFMGMVSLLIVMLTATMVFVLYEFMQDNPITKTETVSVLPTDHRLDRSKRMYLTIQRQICVSREAKIRIIREWIDEGFGVQKVLDDYIVVSGPTKSYPDGCIPRRALNIYPPTSLNSGIHQYRVTAEWCSRIGVCHYTRFPDIEIELVNDPPEAYRRPETTMGRQ